MEQSQNFTAGRIAGPLIRFAVPVLLAMLLQSLYSAVDMAIVGKFATSRDVSAVATGGGMMWTVMSIIMGLSMGITILLGQAIGRGDRDSAGDIVGSGICFFFVMSLVLTVVMMFVSRPFAVLMNAPKEAFEQTVAYTRICAAGILFITGYNVVGSVFRGMGDSKTPLLTVAIATVFNIAGDLLLVAVFKMGAAGAAYATIAAQAISVIASLFIVSKRGLPFTFSKRNIRFNGAIIKRAVRMGRPIALQDSLVSISFLFINSIVNSLGVIASAAVGVSDRVLGFIFLVPSAFSSSVSSFVAQNFGAGKLDRARKALVYSMGISLVIDIFMAYLTFFHGDVLNGFFSRDPEVIRASIGYMKANAIDTILCSFLFCFNGYFTGCGDTKFVMVQGIAGAFLVRIPIAYMMSVSSNPTLFRIGLGTPASTFAQIVLCVAWYIYTYRHTEMRSVNNAL